MIDTALIRSKVLEQAVMGELSVEFDSNVDSLIELREASNRNVVETKNEVPYELKEGWHWFALSELGSDDKHSFADGPFGSNLKKEHYTENAEVRIIQLSNVGELGWKNENVRYTTFEHLVTIQRSEVKAGNIVIAKMMPAGRAIIVPDIDEKYVLSSDCVKFVPCELLNTEYLCYAINSSMFRKQVLQDVHGIGRERTSLSKLKTYLLPIPCRAEQDYIVEKINKAYEQLASLDILQIQYSSDLEVLKSKIIDAGIQGKLTEQLPEDGTAEELSKNHIDDIINQEEKILDIPSNWSWIKLGWAMEIERGGSPRPIKAFVTDADDGINWIKIGDVAKDGKYIYQTKEKIKPEGEQKSRKVYPGDFLLTNSMSFGRPYISKIEGCIHDGWLLLRNTNELFDLDYLYWLLSSGYAFKQFSKKAAGATVDNLNKDKVASAVIPLPPLSEQKRIANVLEEIMNKL